MSLFDFLIPRKKTGLVLGGGGARGFYHIGVIKALQELGVKIDEVSGTSIGAIVGVLYAANPDINFEKLIEKLDFLKILSIVATRWDKKFEERVAAFLIDYLPAKTLEELQIPMTFNAVDINNGKEITYRQGNIFPGLVASMAIPGVFPPVVCDGKYLVDGGVLNNVPISAVSDCDRIIVSDITGPIKKIDTKSNPIDLLYSTIGIMQKQMSLQLKKEEEELKKRKLVLLTLEDQTISVLDFRKQNYRQLIDMGYKAVMDNKEQLLH